MQAVGRIGVMIPALRDELDCEYLQGIQDQAAALGYDSFVFTNVTNALDEFTPNDYVDGENNIFTLLKDAKLDGILFPASKFWHKALVQSILDMLEAVDALCLVVGMEQGQHPYLFASEEDAFYMITRHLLQAHQVQSCWCLTGPQGNHQAESRLVGFRKAVEEAHLPPEAIRVIYGDFWKDAAQTLGLQIAGGALPMPEAIVCASDIMALSLCETLEAKGIRIPEQIKVTGYDGNRVALEHSPSITTVSGLEYRLGQLAVNRLYALMKHQKSPLPVSECTLQAGESCGCVQDDAMQRKTNREMLWERMFISQWYEMYATSNYIVRMSEAESLNELILTIDGLSHLLPLWQRLELCLCKDWLIDVEHPELIRNSGYSQRMDLMLSKRFAHENDPTPLPFVLHDLLPSLQEPHTPRLIFFTPLHYNLQVFGYFATTCRQAADFRVLLSYSQWFDAVSNGLRALQNKLYTRQIEQKMAEYARKDQMTGLYNRRGFLDQAPAFFEHLGDGGKSGILLLLHCQERSPNHTELEEKWLLSIANAIQLTCQIEELAAHIQSFTFALLMPLDESAPLQEQTDRRVMQFEKVLDTIRQKAKIRFQTQILSDLSIVHVTQISVLNTVLDERLHILSEKLRAPVTESSDYASQLEQICREIRMEPQQDWSLNEIASRLGISVSYLLKVYFKQFGTSIKEDVIAARMQKAKHLLRTTSLRIAEISDRCGYSDVRNFMRQFKKHTGETAKQYRDEVQNS